MNCQMFIAPRNNYGHLPEISSAEEIKAGGMSVGETTTLLLQKIEELTLYTIEQEKRIREIESRLSECSGR